MAQQIVNIGTIENDGTGDPLRTAFDKLNDNFSELYPLHLDNRVIIKQASDFGIIDSTKQYFIDGVVDMGSTQITVPVGGIHINGYGLDVSKLTSSNSSYIMFIDASGDSGNVLVNNCTIEVSGAGSSVFALTSNTGFEAAEFNIVNFDNCTSMGYLDGFRQGLENGTGRFGGTPELELRGTWSGGYRITTSIARILSNASTYSLFKCALGQTFNSRFGGNPNIDLPSNVSFIECTESNFINDNTLQLQDALFSGDGTVLNGITETSSKVRVSNTSGIQNTYVGGFWSITTEATTNITLSNTYVKLLGTTTYNGLTWFGNGGGNNTMTYESTEPIKIKSEFVGSFTGSNNRSFSLRFRVWDDSASSYIDYAETVFTTNGGILSDRAESVVLISPFIELDVNDRIEVWIANNTDVTDITALLNSRLIIEELKS